jgi:hypothetical protein
VQAALERALAELTLGDELDAANPDALRAFCDRHGIAKRDADYLQRTGIQRLLSYRRLVRSNLRDAIEVAMPRVVARLGPIFDEYFARFVKELGPRTHYLRDVCPEFLSFSAPLWALDRRIEAYLLELADHESLQIEMASMVAQPSCQPHEQLALDEAAEFIEACRIVRYDFALHELSEDEDDRSEPRQEATWLLVYRSAEHEVRYLKLTDLAAAILARLVELHEPLGAAVQTACERAKQPMTADVLTGTAELLADLAERGVLLGRRRPG